MNRSKPSTVIGGGEMKRDTSSVVSSAKSDDASDARISRRVTVVPASIGRLSRQSELTVVVTEAGLTRGWKRTSCPSSSVLYGIFSMTRLLHPSQEVSFPGQWTAEAAAARPAAARTPAASAGACP